MNLSNTRQNPLEPSVQRLIERLGLEAHDEGGYFRQIHQSEWTCETPDRPGGTRYGINTIYYLMTADSPVGHLHRNRSDIIHFFHAGSPIAYYTVSPHGQLQRAVLGPDPDQGHVFQMTVPGGYWKTSVLEQGAFGLLSEAVAPGFDYRDRELATPGEIQRLFPRLWPQLEAFTLTHPKESHG